MMTKQEATALHNLIVAVKAFNPLEWEVLNNEIKNPIIYWGEYYESGAYDNQPENDYVTQEQCKLRCNTTKKSCITSSTHHGRYANASIVNGLKDRIGRIEMRLGL